MGKDERSRQRGLVRSQASNSTECFTQTNNRREKKLQRQQTENQGNKKEEEREESRARMAHDIPVPTLAGPWPAPMSVVFYPHATFICRSIIPIAVALMLLLAVAFAMLCSHGTAKKDTITPREKPVPPRSP